ncbi:hypothetical protein HZS_1716 [Henneguya salminicola]|nr:hypothetical protein HZS_1716 [Henneguya salminicola]
MNISIPTFILIVLFSIGSWIDINSIFSQLSFLVTTLPESTELYSYFALIIQSANICPLIYGILRKYYPKYMDEKIAIFTILVGCTISMVIVAYIHNVVVDIFYGRSSSLPLFFMLLLIACLQLRFILT